MPEDLRIRVGNLAATVPLGGTPAQIGAALSRFATSLGIPINGTPTENLTAILEHFRDDVKTRSKAVQTAEKRAVADATILQEVENDNPL